MDEERIDYWKQMDAVSDRAHALGEDATQAQKDRLVEFIRVNVGQAYYSDASRTAYFSGCDITAAMSMLMAEAA